MTNLNFFPSIIIILLLLLKSPLPVKITSIRVLETLLGASNKEIWIKFIFAPCGFQGLFFIGPFNIYFEPNKQFNSFFRVGKISINLLNFIRIFNLI